MAITAVKGEAKNVNKDFDEKLQAGKKTKNMFSILKNNKGKNSDKKIDKNEVKNNIKKNGFSMARAWFNTLKVVKGAFVIGIYVTAMMVFAYIAIVVTGMFCATMIGKYGIGEILSLVDTMTFYLIMTMCCGFGLFFSFKVENFLIKSMKNRLNKINSKEFSEKDYE